MNKKIIVAMSGGVDSSVTALILNRQGYDCIGVTMKLFSNDDIGVCQKNTCCSLDDVEDARNIAYKLGMKYYVFNFSSKFEETVINKFIHSYENGMTPNPCIDCNRYLKFDKLFQRAKELDYNFIATGHYAQIEYSESRKRWILKKAVDCDKDQSYVLYSLTQDQLEHTLFPLGKMTKTEVRDIAQKDGFVNAQKHDSQDICFVKDKNYADFIENYTGKSYLPGNFVDVDGNVLGTHKGIIHYTVGQRKGLGLSLKQPMYVCKVDPVNNTVVLTAHEGIYTKKLVAKDINFIATDNLFQKTRLKAKVRYRQKEQWATVIQIDSDIIEIEFDEPQRAITKGQAVVLYDEDIVVGGGTICETCD